MADTDLIKALSEEVRCNICLELFTDPRVLDCMHTFCLGCISQIVRRTSGRTAVDCPLCRAVTLLGPNQAQGLKRNHYLANIANKLRVLEGDDSGSSSSTTQPVNSVHTPATSLPSYNPAYTNNNNNNNNNIYPPVESHYPAPSAPPLYPEDLSQQPRNPPQPEPHRNPPPPPPAQSQPYLSSVTSFFSNLLYGSRNEPPQPPVHAINEEFFYIPFSFPPSEVPNFYNQWANSLWLLPSDFTFEIPASAVSAMYVPYWVYDVTVNTKCSAKVSRTDADPRDTSRATTENWLNVDTDYMHVHPKLMICAAVQDYQPAAIGLVEQLDWKLEDGSIRSNPGPPLDLTVVRYQGHDVIWHEVAEKVIRSKEREKCEFDLKSQPLIANVKEVTLEINFLNVEHKLIYFPVYVASYTYGESTYQWVCNGITGGSQGNRPYGLGKLADMSRRGYDYVSSFIFNKS